MTGSASHAAQLAADVTAARHKHAFETAVHAFVTFLSGVPDSAAGEWTREGLSLVRARAEDVVEAIEQRLEAAGGSGHAEQRLAESIYGIRRALEEIDRWERHFLP
jgi:hypothetical protein